MKFLKHISSTPIKFAAIGPVLLCLLMARTIAAADVLDNDPNLVLHFDFESQPTNGVVLDTSGYGNDGYQFNQTNLLAYTNGVFGGTAAQFSYVGVMLNDPPQVYPFSQYIAVTNLRGFAYLTNGTISFFAQFAPNTNNGIYMLDSGYNVLYQGAQASNSWTLGRNYQHNLSFWVFPGSGGYNTIVSWPNDAPSADYSTARMHLYTVTLDCVSNTAVAYYDGSPYKTNAIGVPWLRIFGSKALPWLCIGAMAHAGTPQWGDDPYPNTAFFAGQLDDLRIYNRTLSAAEVKALYQNARTVIAQMTAPQVLQISWFGQSNVSYQVESCADLSGTIWSPLGTPVLSSGKADSVSNALDSGIGFYRVRPVP